MFFKRCTFSLPGHRLALVLIFLNSLISADVFGQITNGNVAPEEEQPTTAKEKKQNNKTKTVFSEDSLNGTNFYLSGFYQYSYRQFEDQSNFQYYQDWESQTHDFTGGFNLGLLMQLNDFTDLDLGFSYFGHGENYSFQDSLTDSSYTYTNIYRQIAIPLRLRVSYGNNLKVFGFAGIAPLNIINIRYNSSYYTEDSLFIEREPEIKKDGFATFNLMLSAGLGLQYNIKYVGIMIYPEYRRHLFNTYSTKTISMDHKMYGFALNAGLVLRF